MRGEKTEKEGRRFPAYVSEVFGEQKKRGDQEVEKREGWREKRGEG